MTAAQFRKLLRLARRDPERNQDGLETLHRELPKFVKRARTDYDFLQLDLMHAELSAERMLLEQKVARAKAIYTGLQRRNDQLEKEGIRI